MSKGPDPAPGGITKRRPSGLFDDDTPPRNDGPRKPISNYLKETPSEPLSGKVKALIWIAAAIVAILLLLTIYKVMIPRSSHAQPTPKTALVGSKPSSGYTNELDSNPLLARQCPPEPHS